MLTKDDKDAIRQRVQFDRVMALAKLVRDQQMALRKTTAELERAVEVMWNEAQDDALGSDSDAVTH